MADNKTLTTKPADAMSIPGTFQPDDFLKFIGEGFASVETVLFGDPKAGKLPFYVGRLEGPADPVEVGDENVDSRTGEVKRNTMPTWVFHPAVRNADGSVGFAENVTHVVPCAYQVDAACKRIHKNLIANGGSAIVGIAFIGKDSIKGGSRQMNRYKVFEKYTPAAKG